MKLRVLFLALLFLPLSGYGAIPAYPWQSEFENYLDGIMSEFHVPGIAVEVVGEDGPILQITKGYRNIEKNLPVTANTLFAIGSTTKAFTGVLLAGLYDQGKLSFDAPVQSYLLDFHVADEAASKLYTLRDLVGHYTGVGRNDIAWYHRGLTRANILNLVQYLPLSAEPRTTFIYNNWMWTVSGVVAEALYGETWEQLVHDKIFAPLGMSSTNTSLDETLHSGDYSLAYSADGSGARAIPFLDIKEMNPAGGIYSNLNDMAKWMQFHLRKGMAGGQRLLSENALEETYKPYSKISASANYAMGWALLKFKDQSLLTHDGGVDGFTSNVSFMPDKKLGVIILTQASEVTPQHVAFRIWQYLNGVEKPSDWVRTSIKQARDQEEENKKAYADKDAVALDRLAESFVGDFCNPLYGKAIITKTDDKTLHVKMNMFDVNLYGYGPLKFAIRGFFSELKYVNFTEGKDHAISGLEWKLEGSGKDWVKFGTCSK